MQPELEFAISLAHAAGEIMKSHIKIGMKWEMKDDNSPVTEADKLINSIVIERVKENYPSYSIVGEENSFYVDGSEFSWVCDPIDGTIPFSHGIPISMFSLALTQNGVPIVAVLYDPFSDRLFQSTTGNGSFLNGTQIHVSSQSQLKGATLEVCGSSQMPLVAGTGCRVTKMYCGTCPSSLLACGQYDGVLYPGKSCWDIAAIKLIVEEAGGKVTDLNGNEQRYDQPINGAVVSNGVLHDILVALTKR